MGTLTQETWFLAMALQKLATWLLANSSEVVTSKPQLSEGEMRKFERWLLRFFWFCCCCFSPDYISPLKFSSICSSTPCKSPSGWTKTTSTVHIPSQQSNLMPLLPILIQSSLHLLYFLSQRMTLLYAWKLHHKSKRHFRGPSPLDPIS